MIEDQEITSKASLITYFENIIPLNQKEKAFVSEKFQLRLYRKKQYVEI
ncbi:hypothetical protein LPB87_18300 [Flavobacterium sp. EDS]|nr:hypothetical protein [Flavobacterium sp. EDS]MCD0476347.1 hypothetical protein [Flavobacterium sp. EDS]